MVELSKEALDYVQSHQEELEQLILDLCRIPAPSHHEEKRAQFCKEWFIKAGGQGAYIDEALNVVCPWHYKEEGPVIVMMAHTDTVFPDTEPMEPVVTEKRIACPGVGDDTANLAVLMMAAKYVMQKGIVPNCGVLFVANSCEEGLGNLKGSRQIMKDFGDRVKYLISYDGYMNGMTVRAVGSCRFKVEVRTEGGHSYANFGNRNAIHMLSSMIDTLYDVKIPKDMGLTTYNVGSISGGTSVNTIAQSASMLCEYRSDKKEGMAFMQNVYDRLFETYRAMGVDVQVELIGERPCSGNPDPETMKWLQETAQTAIETYAGMKASAGSGSTDCNIPLSMDIPAICPGVVCGGGAHTRQEYIERDSLLPGLKVGLALMLSYIA